MRTAAILPVKRFAAAKSRLGASVAQELRGELARAMVADVLLALSRVASLECTIVVTREPDIIEPARALGALIVPDSDEQGQSAAVMLGGRRAPAQGIERVRTRGARERCSESPSDRGPSPRTAAESAMASVSARAVGGLPELRPGDDLAALIASASASADIRLADGQLVTIAHKAVSKCEGALVALADVQP